MSASPRIIPVSARTHAALVQTGARLARHLLEHPELDLNDVATTLATREAFAHRCAVVAADLSAAAAGLTEALRASSSGVALADSAAAEAEPLAAVAEMWCRGVPVDLARGPGRRIHLPGYAFDHDGGATAAATQLGEGVRPLTARQQRLIFHDLVRSGSSAAEHNVAAAAEVGGVSVAALQAAFADLQRAHAILRTVFRRVDERWVSVEQPDPLVAIDVRPGSESGALDDLLAELRRHRFELVDAPLVHAELVTTARGRVLAVVLHAAVADEIAPETVLAELTARTQSHAPVLDPA